VVVVVVVVSARAFPGFPITGASYGEEEKSPSSMNDNDAVFGRTTAGLLHLKENLSLYPRLRFRPRTTEDQK
jgi:hypothetical protein